MDCSGKEGNKGCQGGIMESGYKYIVSNGGLDSETEYTCASAARRHTPPPAAAAAARRRPPRDVGS